MKFQVVIVTSDAALARRLYDTPEASVEQAILYQALNPKLPNMMLVVDARENAQPQGSTARPNRPMSPRKQRLEAARRDFVRKA